MPAKRWGRRPDGRAARGVATAVALRAYPSALRRQGRGQRPPAAVFPGHRSRGLPGRSWDRPAVAPRIAAAQGQQRLPHGEPGLGARGRGGEWEGASYPRGLSRRRRSPFAGCPPWRDRALMGNAGRERARVPPLPRPA